MTDAEVAAYLFGVRLRLENADTSPEGPQDPIEAGVDFSDQEQNAYRRLGPDVFMHWADRGFRGAS